MDHHFLENSGGEEESVRWEARKDKGGGLYFLSGDGKPIPFHFSLD